MIGLENVLEAMRENFAPTASAKDKKVHVAVTLDKEHVVVYSEESALLDKETLCCQRATD